MDERRTLESTLGEMLSPENFTHRMLACQQDWDVIDSMIVAIQDKLRNAEDVRKARLRAPRIEEGRPTLDFQIVGILLSSKGAREVISNPFVHN